MQVTERQEKLCNLIREYRLGLFRVAKGILSNDADAEDAVSETTCKAFANLDQLRNFASFKPWVMKILVNEAYAIANKRKRFAPPHILCREGIFSSSFFLTKQRMTQKIITVT